MRSSWFCFLCRLRLRHHAMTAVHKRDRQTKHNVNKGHLYFSLQEQWEWRAAVGCLAVAWLNSDKPSTPQTPTGPPPVSNHQSPASLFTYWPPPLSDKHLKCRNVSVYPTSSKMDYQNKKDLFTWAHEQMQVWTQLETEYGNQALFMTQLRPTRFHFHTMFTEEHALWRTHIRSVALTWYCPCDVFIPVVFPLGEKGQRCCL